MTAVLTLPSACSTHDPAPKVEPQAWVTAAAQATSTVRAVPARDETCREVLRATAAGRRIRLRLSNTMSTTPLALAAVTVGLRQSGADLIGPPTPVTIHGDASPVVPAGTALTTDPVDLRVAPGLDIAVSFAVTGSARLSEHLVGAATGWCTGPGTGDITADTRRTSFVVASREGLVVEALEVLEVLGAQPAAHGDDGILAVGDSLTDPPLPPDTYRRWTDVLTTRTGRAVANVGIGGNRVVLPGGYGPTLVERFERDVLARPGADTIVLFSGTNDVSSGIAATDLIARLHALCGKARTAGLRVVLVTLAPAWRRSPAAEAVRQDVNAWIRSTPDADTRVDADDLLRDPRRPTHLLRSYDWGDGLHVSAAGHRVLGEAVAEALTD